MPTRAGNGRIFLVDDDPDVRNALALVLRTAGYEILTAGDGQEALDALQGMAPPPCLILLDLMVPVMDGFELRVRQIEHRDLADIPVIVFSGGGDVERKARTLGVAAVLTKPVDTEALLEQVAHYCATG